MNSMFSCFDALCADLLSAKTLKTSFFFSSSSSSSSSQPNRALVADDKPTKKVTGNGEFPLEKKVKKQQIGSAPEFDGLNCFETLVRY